MDVTALARIGRKYMRQIIALGGLLAPETGKHKIERYIVDSAGVPRPRVCLVGTASGDDAEFRVRALEMYLRCDARPVILPFFRRTPSDLRAFLAEFDIIHVGGGNTRSMLAVWREWNFVEALREAYERGAVLCGSSAGAICWFEAGVTDSVAGDLTSMKCLGFLAGSNCPHYDGEKDRRPAYQLMVREGLISPGIACDDGPACISSMKSSSTSLAPARTPTSTASTS